MIQKIKDAWKSESTPLGKFLHTWVFYILAGLGAVAELSAYLPMLPPMIADTIPLWLKHTVLFAGIGAHVIGRLTVKKQDGSV